MKANQAMHTLQPERYILLEDNLDFHMEYALHCRL